MTCRRRSRATCSPELLALYRFVATLALDVDLAKAMDECEGNMRAAARLLGIRHDALRQRNFGFLRRVGRLVPAFSMRAGPVAREISYGEERFSSVLGVE